MTTLKAFNEMMGQFLDELHETFPEEEIIKAAKNSPRDRKTFDNFMAAIGHYSAELMRKDDAFFTADNKFIQALNLHVIWASENATPNTKDAIWQYLQTMYILGNTINMFPPETLNMIESAAESCAQNMKAQGKTPDSFNEKDLMAGMNSMLSQMLGSGGGSSEGNPLAALMGAMQTQPPPRAPKKKAPRKKSQ